jgi:hypothetical protein
MRLTVRERLEERLRSLGWTIEPGHRLNTTAGWYRVNQRFDDTIVCWETWARRATDLFPHHLVSYDTMTECARGCVVDPEPNERHPNLFWVSATKERAARIKPVTDPDLDAPDGSVVDGWRRSGDAWVRI